MAIVEYAIFLPSKLHVGHVCSVSSEEVMSFVEWSWSGWFPILNSMFPFVVTSANSYVDGIGLVADLEVSDISLTEFSGFIF